jgi:hypothetical protein
MREQAPASPVGTQLPEPVDVPPELVPPELEDPEAGAPELEDPEADAPELDELEPLAALELLPVPASLFVPAFGIAPESMLDDDASPERREVFVPHPCEVTAKRVHKATLGERRCILAPAEPRVGVQRGSPFRCRTSLVGGLRIRV